MMCGELDLAFSIVLAEHKRYKQKLTNRFQTCRIRVRDVMSSQGQEIAFVFERVLDLGRIGTLQRIPSSTAAFLR